MTETKSGKYPLLSEQDIVLTRQAVRKLSQELRFTLVDQTKMVTATSELARNTLIHGGGGEMVYEVIQDGLRVGLRLTFVDQGPGIPNLEMALMDGWTSKGGMGLGLSGSKRLVNEFEIESVVDEGTRITVTRWK